MLRIQSITPSTNGLCVFLFFCLYMKQMIFKSHYQNGEFEVVVYHFSVYVLGYLCLVVSSLCCWFIGQNTPTPYTVNRCPNGQWTGRSLAPAVDLNLTAPDLFFDEPELCLFYCLIVFILHIYYFAVKKKERKVGKSNGNRYNSD